MNAAIPSSGNCVTDSTANNQLTAAASAALVYCGRVAAICLLALCCLAMAPASSANTGAAAAGDSVAAEPSAQDLSELIELLENPEGREAFLEKVRQLEQARRAVEPEDSLELSQAIDLDQKVGEFMHEYLALFTESEFRAGSVGVLIMVFALTLVAALIAFLNSWTARALDTKFNLIRKRLQLAPTRFHSVFTWQRVSGFLLVSLSWLYALLVIVFDQAPGSSVSQIMVALLQTTVAVLLVTLIFLLIWEIINAVLESLTERKETLSSRRAKTLLPVVRNIITLVLMVLSALVILSELGVDVVPLLAGAGVVGIAVGFGAQKLVQDFLTGFTIILEDLLQVGDVVRVSDRQGYVTRISMRKLELRSLEGTVHTIPFSAIEIVDNLTKDFAYYMFDVGVAYRENTDEVVECLRQIDEELRTSDDFKDSILEPLEVLGVDEFADSAVIIKARTKTRARDKWLVGREFNRRMKIAFDERGIEIPFPHQTLYFGVDKEGNAPPLPPVREARDAGDAETAG